MSKLKFLSSSPEAAENLLEEFRIESSSALWSSYRAARIGLLGFYLIARSSFALAWRSVRWSLAVLWTVLFEGRLIQNQGPGLPPKEIYEVKNHRFPF